MTAVVDEYVEGSLETDDIFPCKGCGEILEEGKAFELAGQRWHLNCFRCHSCDTLLDSDANLLLLGDGSLVCNNCTYTCNACGNKIEDLAILTGDQAFCSTCFRCRNCKRKIENLRYARTSQGIFCMGCHETITARRRKRSKAAAASKAREKEASPMITEKSLPALPPEIAPGAVPVTQADHDSDDDSTSPRTQTSAPRFNNSSRIAPIPARSPERPTAEDGNAANRDNLTLPSSTYRKNRNSAILPSGHASNQNDSPDSFYISVALDPSPSASGSSKSPSESNADTPARKPKAGNEQRTDAAVSPHIAFQEKGRKQSSDHILQAMAPSRRLSKNDKDRTKASHDTDESKAEASRSKRLAASRTNSSQSTDVKQSNGASRNRPSQEARSPDDEEPVASPELNAKLPRSGPGVIARKELPPSANRILANSANTTEKSTTSDNYMQPRIAPAPPGSKASAGAKDDGQSPKVSPKLPVWSSGADFTLDEDMARILGTDQGSSSILRRVSNAVRHGRTGSIESGNNITRQSHARSISETTRSTMSPQWSRSQHANDHPSHDISSPIPFKSDDSATLKRQLRNSEQRVAQLERQFTTEKDLQSLDKKLVEKRKTVSVLDTKADIMIRQLEVLAGYVENAKETKAPIDVQELEDSAIKDFVKKLERVKAAMSSEIEQLHEQRDKLLEERDQATADRDRALLEFEQLSSKNAQLAEMNNEMTHQIQERFKSQVGDMRSSSNGLGIYGQRGSASSNANLDAASLSTGATLIPADEEPIVESGPTVVQVRKGQVKKFNWKKGSKTVAQNVAKGVNRAVVAFQQNERERPYQGPGQQGNLTADNIGLPYNMTVTQADMTGTLGAGGPNSANKQQGFGFFGKKNGMPKSVSANTVSTPLAAEPPSTLFGSELTERAEHERRQIPSVVTRCIEEVELRGMDQEGIYRKTGGNSQINQIKEGFEKSENFDISDPDLDITAVTSVLKQYFRKLPMPLLTFDVYDRVLESNAVSDEAERCSQLRKTFDSMPQSHRDCLEFLMFHLQRVAQREPENLMSPKNLAVVFAPTIMRDLSIEREMTDMHAKNIAVQFVIENSHIIFEEP